MPKVKSMSQLPNKKIMKLTLGGSISSLQFKEQQMKFSRSETTSR
jgi:hypothetical protein